MKTITTYRIYGHRGAIEHTATASASIPGHLAMLLCRMARTGPAEYLDRTQAWRPLDLHPDWRPWPGATTEGNTK